MLDCGIYRLLITTIHWVFFVACLFNPGFTISWRWFGYFPYLAGQLPHPGSTGPSRQAVKLSVKLSTQWLLITTIQWVFFVVCLFNLGFKGGSGASPIWHGNCPPPVSTGPGRQAVKLSVKLSARQFWATPLSWTSSPLLTSFPALTTATCYHC